MKIKGFDLEKKFKEIYQEKKIKLDMNLSLNSFKEIFTSFVEKMKNVDAELSEEKEFSKNDESRPKKFFEIMERYSFFKLENNFQDQQLAKSLEDIYIYIDRIKLENDCPNKLHEQLKNYSVQLKENFQEFKSESDCVLLNDNEKNAFYIGQGTYDPHTDIIIKNGKGIYKDENENIYFGIFIDGYFVEGIFSKREKDNSFSYYFGKFSGLENLNDSIFQGIFFPSSSHYKKTKMIFFNGEIKFQSNSFQGIFLFLTDNLKLEIYQGNMIKGRKDGNKTTLITYSKNYPESIKYDSVSINQISYSNGKPLTTGILYNSQNHLIEFDFDTTKNHKSIYLKNIEGVANIYIGDVKYNEEDKVYIQNSCYGKFILPNGDCYFGEIKKGIKEGNGRFYHKNSSGKIMTSLGLYENDIFKVGKIFEDQNLIYDGKFVSNMMSEGKFYFLNDEKDLFYEGKFKNGGRDGKGTNVYKDGSRYEGDWENNQRHGKGTYLYSNEGPRYTGDWNKNQKNGKALIEKDLMKFSTNWENNNLVSLSN